MVYCNRMRTLRLGLIGILGIGVAAYVYAHPPRLTAGGIDFSAFYCGARVLSTGADPYQYEPVRSCEHANRQWSRRSDIVAVPLPPYALGILIPLARLPYAQASLLWFMLLVVSALAIVWAILQLADLPFLVVGTCVALAVFLQAMPTGALAPIPLALLCAAAVMLTRKLWNATAALLGFACIEPHVALPVLLATFVLVREMRWRIVAVASALILFSLALGRLELNTEYLSKYLPAHALSELGSVVQFGLSSMLHNFGVPDGAALAIGSAQYGLFVFAGILLARSLRREVPAMTVLVPLAFAVTGGPYIHLTQIAGVLPLAFVTASRTRSRVAWAGIVLLTVPWNLLNALTPNALVVPRAHEVMLKALAHQAAPGGFAYIANALVYLGIACTFWSVMAGRNRRLR